MKTKSIFIFMLVIILSLLVTVETIYIYENKNQITQSSNLTTTTSTTLTTESKGLVFERYIDRQSRRFEMDIPTTWSKTHISQMIGKDKMADLPTFSIGTKNVSYGDTNWDQVDFYFIQDDISSNFNKNEENDGGTRGKEIIGGIEAYVSYDSLDNGEVTKAGTGGRSYFVNLSSIKNYDCKGLIIHVQSKGSQEFQDNIDKVLKSIKFTNN